MGYDWTSEDDKPVLSEGFHFVEVTEVRTQTKDGNPILSKNKEKMIFVTIEDTLDRSEQGVPLMLEGRGVFQLKTLLSRSGADMERMKVEGVDPTRFSDPAFAEKQLLGRKVWAFAERKGVNTNISFIKEEEVPPLVVRDYGGGATAPPPRQFAPPAPVAPPIPKPGEPIGELDEAHIPFSPHPWIPA